MLLQACFAGRHKSWEEGLQDPLQWLLLAGAHELCSSPVGPRSDPNRIS